MLKQQGNIKKAYSTPGVCLCFWEGLLFQDAMRGGDGVSVQHFGVRGGFFLCDFCSPPTHSALQLLEGQDLICPSAWAAPGALGFGV